MVGNKLGEVLGVGFKSLMVEDLLTCEFLGPTPEFLDGVRIFQVRNLCKGEAGRLLESNNPG